MHQHPELPMNSADYLQVMVEYNLALGHCLGLRICTAKDYDRACKMLVGGTWPTTAPQAAVTHETDPPELLGLFQLPPRPGLPKGMVWHEVERELLFHPRYHLLIWIRSRNYCQQLDKKGTSTADLPLLCLDRVIRNVIGRAEHWAAHLHMMQTRHPTEPTTWLDLALNWCRHEVTRTIRRHLGLPIGNHPQGQAETCVRIYSLADLPGTSDEPGPIELTISCEPDPVEDASSQERKRIVQEAIARLPLPLREVYGLRDQELSFDQISQQLGITLNAAKYRYRQALEHLCHDEHLRRAYGTE